MWWWRSKQAVLTPELRAQHGVKNQEGEQVMWWMTATRMTKKRDLTKWLLETQDGWKETIFHIFTAFSESQRLGERGGNWKADRAELCRPILTRVLTTLLSCSLFPFHNVFHLCLRFHPSGAKSLSGTCHFIENEIQTSYFGLKSFLSWQSLSLHSHSGLLPGSAAQTWSCFLP